MRSRCLVIAACLCVAASCRLESGVAPRTQVVVDVDADASVREQTERLELVVVGSADRDQIGEAEPSLARAFGAGEDTALQWPLRLALTPRDDRAERVFMLRATAFGAEQVQLVEARATSSYVAGEVRHLRLVLRADCLRVRCEAAESCAAGSCGDAWVEARELPRFWPGVDAAVGDAGALPNDAGPGLDAGRDASGAAGSVAVGSPEGGQTLPPCEVTHGGCDPLVTCESRDGVVLCGECPPGYTNTRGDGTLCEDVDECQQGNGGCDLRHGQCTNTPGGRSCTCKDGYHGDGKRCLLNTPCSEPSGCSPMANCQAVEERLVCVCKPGYAGDGAECDDIDECAAHSDNCDDRPAACVNDPGSFHCQCPSGYVGTALGSNGCSDVDECAANTDNCDDQPEACANDVGTFHCVCPSGYGGDGRTGSGCMDVNECAANTDGCDDTPDACVNDPGTFHCACPTPGYVGGGMGTEGCMDVDECAVNSDGCDDVPNACVNDPGAFHCACPNGYTGDGKGSGGCADIDECATNQDDCIDLVDACVNDPGTFHCRCPTGYTGSGSGPASCADIDECATGMHTCSRTPQVVCSNTIGSFSCGTCPAGYTGDGHTCMDIDECANGLNTCSLNPLVPCTNTPGSYLCGLCPAGFMGDGLTCVDRDECLDGTHTCSRSPAVSCSNTVGSFVCGSCPSGYTGDGHTCADNDECLTNNGGCDTAPMAQCLNTTGSFTCMCPSGTTAHGGGLGVGGCEPSCLQCYEGWDGQSGTCSSTRSAAPLSADTAQDGMLTFPSDTLFGMQIALPAQAHVTGLGVFSRAAGDGPRFRIGLYNDAGGAPGTLLTQTAWFQMLASNVANELPPQGAVSCLVAPGMYWVVGVASGNDVVLGQAAAGAALAISLPGQSDLPGSWPGGVAAASLAPLSLFVRYDHP